MFAMLMLVIRAMAKEVDSIGTQALFNVIAVQLVKLTILLFFNFGLEALHLIKNN